MFAVTSDMIEVCSRCGKMPRGIDLGESGLFRCTRCGNTALTPVTNSDYEKIVADLDRKYHAEIVSTRIANVRKTHPIKMKARAGKKSAAKKSASKPAKAKKGKR
jgi:DNA-directed RNA polymerase subunit RPC12/RpoP